MACQLFPSTLDVVRGIARPPPSLSVTRSDGLTLPTTLTSGNGGLVSTVPGPVAGTVKHFYRSSGSRGRSTWRKERRWWDRRKKQRGKAAEIGAIESSLAPFKLLFPQSTNKAKIRLASKQAAAAAGAAASSKCITLEAVVCSKEIGRAGPSACSQQEHLA
ncbi:uncharacterized protein PADG_01009 [Paracoccidioides brasiliensis Pb18]|uniref:Uncharacterized protein n=1 Tax=Paracoccidioides brasiliensis (strain Pb18) TaxID=502780 RepID=C1FYY3_PARBD|nr:uncharacterized protein PADG_01009 [Paracoccidioides brasiliensis Pb18]EEH44720.1 hypothetical protein PADG_01009 [Paracoccidioides brasiliensis Pb18]